ncbi:MAG: hypothetical protein LBP92_02365 [Deltaproteobacteria bacterium]|jgi:hypothetical protein|nr:hypothetical protein [Deltaproteobacteria bacterium]
MAADTPETELGLALQKVIVKILGEAVDAALAEMRSGALALRADAMAALKAREYLKAGEVEMLYGIKAGALSNWRSRGLGPPYVRCEGTILYRAADIEGYLDGLREVPGR